MDLSENATKEMLAAWNYSYRKGVAVGKVAQNREDVTLSRMRFFLHNYSWVAQHGLQTNSTDLIERKTGTSVFLVSTDETYAHDNVVDLRAYWKGEKYDDHKPKRDRLDAVASGTSKGKRICIAHFFEVGLGWLKGALDVFPAAEKDVEDDYHSNWDCDKMNQHTAKQQVPEFRKHFGNDAWVFILQDNASYNKCATGDNRILLRSLNTVKKEELIQLAKKMGVVKMKIGSQTYAKKVWSNQKKRKPTKSEIKEYLIEKARSDSKWYYLLRS